MYKSFGNTKASDSLCNILDEYGNKGLTTKVSHIIHTFNRTMKELEDINNNTLYYRCCTHILHSSEKEVLKIKAHVDVLDHTKNILRSTYREGLRKRGIIEPRKEK